MKSKTLGFACLACIICIFMALALLACNDEVPGTNTNPSKDIINNVTVEVIAPKPVNIETEHEYVSINQGKIYFIPLKDYYDVTIIITMVTFVDRNAEEFITIDIPYLIAEQPYSIEVPNIFLSLVSIIGYEID